MAYKYKREDEIGRGGTGGWGERIRGVYQDGGDQREKERCPGGLLVTSPVVHLNDANATCDFRRRIIEPHNTGDVHLLIQRDTSGEVHELKHGVQIIRLPDHLLVSVLEIGPGSTHGEGDLSVLVEEWEGGGRWRGYDAENIWHVRDLDPGNMTVERVVRLEQELHRIDLYDIRSVSRDTDSRKQADLCQKDPRLGTK